MTIDRLDVSVFTVPGAGLVHDVLRPVVLVSDPFDVTGAWAAMVCAARNAGRPGMAPMVIAAVDVALWDLKAKLLDLPLLRLLGAVHDEVAVYGSGGFTSYTDDELAIGPGLGLDLERADADAWVRTG